METYPTSVNFSDNLSSFLKVQEPSTPNNSPSIFEFERFRDVDIDWKKITETSKPKSDPIQLIEDDLDDIRTYFEDAWSEAGATIPDDGSGSFNSLSTKYWRVDNVYLTGTESSSISDVLCLVHPNSSRIYALLNKDGKPLKYYELLLDIPSDPLPNPPPPIPTITNNSAWQKFNKWPSGASKAVQMGIVYTNVDSAKESRCEVEYVQKEVLYYAEEYRRLNAQLEFVERTNAVAFEYLNTLIGTTPPPGGTATVGAQFPRLWNDKEYFENTATKYSNLRTKDYSIRDKIRKLADKVKELGFVLVLKTETVQIPGGPPITLEQGKIYRSTRKIYSWTSQYSQTILVPRRDGCGNTYFVRQQVSRTQYNSTEYNDYTEVNLDIDYVQQKINDLKTGKGDTSKIKNVYVATQKGNGFFSEDGIPIRDILKKCEDNEEFRRKCVIVLPEYDFILSNKSYYTGAFFYYNPLPGLVPIKFPSIGFREDLSYRMIWRGCELGQLMSSINLAPGETRTMTATSKFLRTTSETASFRSVSDVNTSESFDMATEFQEEASRELKKSDSFSASASGSGGFGPFSASASASGSRSTNLTTFSKEMNKIAKKTARNINRKLSQEVSTTNSETTQVSEENTKTITISNINQGSTLNLLFYQLNNRFEGGLYLQELEIMVGSTKELIAGSGVFETFSFRLHELEDVFKVLHPKNLKGKLPANFDYTVYWTKLLDKFIAILKDDYAISVAKTISSTAALLDFPITTQLVEKIKDIKAIKASGYSDVTKELLVKNKSSILDVISLVETPEERLEALIELMSSRKLNANKALAAEIMIIPSGGLYVDSVVGVMPATERYSEQMRNLEANRVATEIEKIDASNDETRARTKLMMQAQNNFISEMWAYPVANNSYKIQLQLYKPLKPNEIDWRVLFETSEIGNPTIELKSGNTVLIITLPGEPPAIDFLETNLMLINKTTDQILKKY